MANAYGTYHNQSVGHSFEYGFDGMALAFLVVGFVALVNLVGYGLAMSFVPVVGPESRKWFHVLAGVAGLLSVLGFLFVGLVGSGITSTSGLFWVAFFVGGAIGVSLVTTVAVFRAALRLGWLKLNVEGGRCGVCGYDLRAAFSGVCPECGEAFVEPPSC